VFGDGGVPVPTSPPWSSRFSGMQQEFTVDPLKSETSHDFSYIPECRC
jgi:hypothetical protein